MQMLKPENRLNKPHDILGPNLNITHVPRENFHLPSSFPFPNKNSYAKSRLHS
jgi:hypothetical protein